MTSPASSRTRRCCDTAGLLIAKAGAIWCTGRGPDRSRSSTWRRTGWPIASKTSATGGLQDNAVAVGVVEGHEPSPRGLLNLARGDAALPQPRHVAVQVVAFKHQP